MNAIQEQGGLKLKLQNAPESHQSDHTNKGQGSLDSGIAASSMRWVNIPPRSSCNFHIAPWHEGNGKATLGGNHDGDSLPCCSCSVFGALVLHVVATFILDVLRAKHGASLRHTVHDAKVLGGSDDKYS